jgi:hypothetical protein
MTTCVLSHRPVTYSSYDTSFSTLHGWDCGIHNTRGYANRHCGGDTKDTPITATQIDANKKWMLAVNGISFITAVLTVPLSSSICAQAAVVYMQQRRKRGFTLRKSLALADRGWWDPYVLSRLFLRRGIEKYGSLFLVLCAVVCGLGI